MNPSSAVAAVLLILAGLLPGVAHGQGTDAAPAMTQVDENGRVPRVDAIASSETIQDGRAALYVARLAEPGAYPGPPADFIPYVLGVQGVDWSAPRDMLNHLHGPPGMGVGMYEDEIVVFLSPSQAAGTNTITLELPDGRVVSTQLGDGVSSEPGAVTQPTLTPTLLPLNQSPELLQFDVGPGVSAADLETIKVGIRLAQTDLDARFGGDLRTDRPVIVKVVAIGTGNQEPGGGGSCCTGLGESGLRPFFDVRHSDWLAQSRPSNPVVARHHIVAHEYAHDWQSSLGCLTNHSHPLPSWMNEGIGEYVGYDAIIRNGETDSATVRAFELNGALSTGEKARGLEGLEFIGMADDLWPGHLGYLAVESLIGQSSVGALSIRRVFQDVAQNMALDEAFVDAFGITRADFYSQFKDNIDRLKTGRP